MNGQKSSYVLKNKKQRDGGKAQIKNNYKKKKKKTYQKRNPGKFEINEQNTIK